MFAESFHMDGMLVDDNITDAPNGSEINVVEGDVQLDLPSYMSAYHGYIYYRRLFFIFERCPALRFTAMRLAHDYIKKHTFDTSAYNKIFFLLAEQQAAAQGLSAAETNAALRGMQGDLNNLPAHVGQRQDSILLPGAGEIVTSGSGLSDVGKLTLTSVMAGKNEAGLCYDAVWEENIRRQSAILLDQMDTELKNSKANLIKESIRREYEALGHLYLKMGRLEDARKCYARTRDYCTSEQQEISMCLNIIKLAIFQGEWSQVNANVTRAYGLSELRDALPSSTGSSAAASAAASAGQSAQSTTSVPSTSASTSSRGRSSGMGRSMGAVGVSERPVSTGSSSYRDSIAQYRTELAIASGLVELSSKNFRGAALKLINVNPDHLESPTSSLVSQSDVGLLVTLCSLASLERHELNTQILGSPTMRLLLETEPVCRDMLQAFQQADYSSLLSRLSPPAQSSAASTSDRRISTTLRDQLRLDVFLADRYAQLVKDIRSRAMCQYFSPYSSACLTKMAAAFDTTVADLENELTTLIQQGSIKARIDSHKQVLRVVNVDQRCMTFSRVMQLVEEYEKRTHSMILRLSLARQKLVRPVQPMH